MERRGAAEISFEGFDESLDMFINYWFVLCDKESHLFTKLFLSCVL